MKKITSVFTLILLSSICLKSQNASVNISHPEVNVADNHNTVQKTPDGSRIFISGERSIINSANNGNSFSPFVARQFNYEINRTFFIDSIRGWGVGMNGRIIHTGDGGINWAPQTSGTVEHINGVYFTSTMTGFAVTNNGKVLSTFNSGGTWSLLSLGIPDDLHDVFFIDANTGWLCGNGGKLYQTTDGGANWNSVSSSTLYDLYDIQFINGAEGWACGANGTVIRTSNGGANWTSNSTSFLLPLYGIHFINSNTGFVCGDQWYIAATTNGGVTWNNITSPFGTTALRSICFANASVGFVVGDNGTIAKSINGGSGWNELNTQQFDGPVKSVFAASSSVVYAIGNGALIKTGDGGNSWINTSAFNSAEYMEDASFVNTTNGYFCGSDGTNGLVSSTNNGGLSVLTQTVSALQRAVCAISISDAVSAGEGGYVYITNSGGSGWTQYYTGNNSNLNSVAFANSTEGMVVGENGVAALTTVGGTSWTAVTTGTFNHLNKVYTQGPGKYFVVGDWGTILYTTNAGANWTSLTTPTGSDITDVYANTSGCVIYIVDSGGKIFYTTDGGTNWTLMTAHPDQPVYGMHLSDENNVWICGDKGYVAKLSGLAFSGASMQVKGNGLVINSGSGAIPADSTYFGNVNVGGSATAHYVINNTGTDPLYISNVVINGINPSEFSLIGGFPPVIAAGTSDTIAVRFSPTSTISFSADINIYSSDCTPSNYTFGLGGMGIPCNMPDSPILTFSNNDSICAGQFTDISISTGNLNDATHWQWYSTACGGTPVTTGTVLNFSGPATETFYVRGEGGCTGTLANCLPVTITVIPNPTFTAFATNGTICAGQDPGLIATGTATDYLWTPGGLTGSNPVTNPNSNTTYTVVGSIPFGCNYTYTVGVAVNPNTDITGTVTYSGGGLTGADILLIRKGNYANQYDTLGYATTGTGGLYAITSAPSDSVYIKVLAPTIMALLEDTYYGNEYLWDSATVVSHGCSANTTNIDITMTEITPPVGLCTLSGTVYEGNGFGMKLIQGPVNPVVYTNVIPGVPIKVGKNPGGSLVATDTTDAGGNWSVGNLPYDTYNIYSDIPGYPMDSFYTVTTSVGNEIISNLIYVADSNSVYIDFTLSVIHQSKENELLLKLFPNPSNGQLFIAPVNGIVQEFVITDAAGRALAERSNIATKEELDLREYGNGVYFYKARMSNGKVLSGKVLLAH